MKNYILGAVLSLGIFATPAFTQAAALTTAQSTSLIAVVQSSPGTPASAFVNLITAFSNITVNQATSLIAVVQASPSTPATAFVDLLTSFTVDTPTTQPATTATNQAVTPTTPQSTTSVTQPTQTNQQATQSAPTVNDQPAQRVVKKELIVTGGVGGSSIRGLNINYKENGAEVEGVPITISATEGYFIIPGLRGKGLSGGTRSSSFIFLNAPHGMYLDYYTDGVNCTGGTESVSVFPGAMITIEASGVTKTIQTDPVCKIN